MECLDDRDDLGTGQSVVDGLPVAPGVHEAQIAHPGEMLRQGGRREARQIGQLPHGFLPFERVAQRGETPAIRKRGKHARGLLGPGFHFGTVWCVS